MNERTIEVGKDVVLGGRTYHVCGEIAVGPNVRNQCPWVKGQWGVQGKRGAVGLLTVHVSGTWTLQFITSGGSRIEKGVL